MYRMEWHGEGEGYGYGDTENQVESSQYTEFDQPIELMENDSQYSNNLPNNFLLTNNTQTDNLYHLENSLVPAQDLCQNSMGSMYYENEQKLYDSQSEDHNSV